MTTIELHDTDSVSHVTKLSTDAQELKKLLDEDDTLADDPLSDFHGGSVAYYPPEGYRACLFHYKDAFVVLYADSNSHYSFCCELSGRPKF